MSELIIRAADLADKWHDGQQRKASLVPGVPYIAHCGEVAYMVQNAGGSDNAVAAAWLHDVLEDTSCTEETLRQVMPARVVDLVLECTEIGTSGPEKAPWQERKDAYIAHLAYVSPSALLISVADKLQSLRGLKHCVRVQGELAYAELVKSAPTIEERRRLTLWFNEEIYKAGSTHVQVLHPDNPIRSGIEALLEDMREIIIWLYRQ